MFPILHYNPWLTIAFAFPCKTVIMAVAFNVVVGTTELSFVPFLAKFYLLTILLIKFLNLFITES